MLAHWREFNRLIRDSGELGIWHERYLVPAGGFEAMYGENADDGCGSRLDGSDWSRADRIPAGRCRQRRCRTCA
ncbi:MAG: monooxygenase family protein [Acidimicrobiia bacterium]